MDLVGQILQAVGGLGILVCFLLVVVQMFQRGQTVLGIVSLVLFLCCSLGHWIAFIYGWVTHRDWRTTNIMLIWTVCIVLAVIGGVLSPNTYARFQMGTVDQVP